MTYENEDRGVDDTRFLFELYSFSLVFGISNKYQLSHSALFRFLISDSQTSKNPIHNPFIMTSTWSEWFYLKCLTCYKYINPSFSPFSKLHTSYQPSREWRTLREQIMGEEDPTSMQRVWLHATEPIV
jgi:hypothetical protein